MSRQAQFETLYRDHAADVRAYVLRRSAPAFADDVISDVFVVVWRRLDDVPADPLPWMYGVARKVLANQRRTAQRQEAVYERMRQVSVSQSDGDERTSGRVIEALKTLSKRDQEVLLLTAWEDLAPARAARVLGIGERAFAMRLHRARRRMASALGTDETTDAGADISPTAEGALQ